MNQIIKFVLIVGGVLLVLTWSLFFISQQPLVRETVSTTRETSGNVTKLMGIAEEIQFYAEKNTALVDSVLRELEKSQIRVAALEDMLIVQNVTIVDMRNQLSRLPEILIPDLDYDEPEDFTDCLDALERCRETAEELLEIIDQQNRRIELMQSQIDAQERSLEIKREIIEVQKKDISMVSTTYEKAMRQARIQKWVGYGAAVAGIAAGLVL